MFIPLDGLITNEVLENVSGSDGARSTGVPCNDGGKIWKYVKDQVKLRLERLLRPHARHIQSDIQHCLTEPSLQTPTEKIHLF